MTTFDKRLAGLSPEKRRLLQMRLAERKRASTVATIERTGASTAALTFAQRRIWFMEQLAPGSPVYNNASVIEGRGLVRIDALQRALDFVVQRHEALRTRFVPESDEAVQVVMPVDEASLRVVSLETEDLRDEAPDAREARLRDALIRAAEEPFDLAAGPPMRVRLVLQTEDQWTLAITFHHLVYDAWSSQRFLAEFVAGYIAAAAWRTP
ncbi:MAG: condensation domain-containing protein, partial [Myxococcota bacterium]